MPQPFRTGNLQLARIDPSAIERAGASMGQAYQQLGNIAATTLEKHRKRKEEKAKVDNMRDQIWQNKDLYDVQTEEEAGVLAKAYHDSPEFMQYEQQAKAAQREQARLAIAKEEADYQRTLRPINEQLTKTNLAGAQAKLSDLEFQRQQRLDEQSAKDLVPYVGQLPSGQLGLDPTTSQGIPSGIASRAIEMKKTAIAAQQKARLETLEQMAKIEKTRSEAQKNYADVAAALKPINPVASEILKKIQDERDILLNTSVTVPGKHGGNFTFQKILEMQEKDPGRFKKIQKQLMDPNSPFLAQLAAYKELERREQQATGGIRVIVDDNVPFGPQPDPNAEPVVETPEPTPRNPYKRTAPRFGGGNQQSPGISNTLQSLGTNWM